MGVKPETEATFQKSLTEMASVLGWFTYHNPDSRRSEAGYPDLSFWRFGPYALRFFFAELKLVGKAPTPAQVNCLEAIRAQGIRAYVWTPADWKEIESVLRDKQLGGYVHVPPQVVTSPRKTVKGRRMRRDELPEWL